MIIVRSIDGSWLTVKRSMNGIWNETDMKTVVRSIGCLLIPVLMVAVSCKDGKGGSQQAAGGMVKEYKVMAVTLQSTTLFTDYPALLKGQQTVDIRPKIAGYIEQILVDEGAQVKKGQLLFRLNDKDLQAAVRSAEAQVMVAEADVNSAKITFEKTKPLVEKSIVSQFDLETASSVLKAKEAQLAQTKANLENVKENLQYTRILSPADGKIGTFPYRIGSLVNSGIAEPLTSVSNTSNVHAYFSLNEKDYLQIVKSLMGQTVKNNLAGFPKVMLILADGSVYDQPGTVDAASGIVDQKTGAVTLRATFKNPDGILHSGGSGAIRIPREIESAVTVPQNATYELQGKHFVYVVTPDNTVRDTEIEVIVGNLKDRYIVTKGLQAGDIIVKEGIATLHTGSTIKPVRADIDNQTEQVASADSTKQ